MVVQFPSNIHKMSHRASLLRVNIQKYMRKRNDFHLAFYWPLHKPRSDKMQKIRKTDMSGLKKKSGKIMRT